MPLAASTRRVRSSCGPVVAAAVELDRDKFPRGIDDSKKLDLDTREAIYSRLQKVARIGVGMASVEEIDQINIYWARMLAMSRAVEALGFGPAWVLVDGNATPRWQRPSKAIVAGDAKCRSIAAASIVAKVTRDRIMADYARDYRATVGSITGAIQHPSISVPSTRSPDPAPSPKLRPGPQRAAQ